MATLKMPALFIGHGNPMNALRLNAWTAAWDAIGRALPSPRAILAVSAHWYVRGTRVTAEKQPKTIHDFGGFPPELFAVHYPAPGDPGFAKRLEEMLLPTPVEAATDWGLDHGTWSVLARMFPSANVPVVQLSIDRTQPPAFHLALGRRLSALRAEGVLILGSGNLVHNLEAYAWGEHSAVPYDWAVRFERRVKELVIAHDYQPLVDYTTLGPDALLAVPTPEHYLPLLYVLGTEGDEAVSFPVSGVDGGSISMLSIQVG
ncbi:MAG TPA: 4,5-DOPA dioxygenase extradiol [Candidatus Angelobacter sp.]|nr:4,5-DOPA dioxygenase extradiol [Candidatus Angelobacter sp.]